MHCHYCICRNCPYGLSCDLCDRMLIPHLIIAGSCPGDKEWDECPLDECAKQHAEPLRELIRAKNYDGIESYFDFKTGAWYADPIRCEWDA